MKKKRVKATGLEHGLCMKFSRLRVVGMRRFWHHQSPMQNDPQGVGRPASATAPAPAATTPTSTDPIPSPPTEIGGPSGPEPTRFGDWEKNGRCIDF